MMVLLMKRWKVGFLFVFVEYYLVLFVKIDAFGIVGSMLLWVR